jgi:hypothetical protein
MEPVLSCRAISCSAVDTEGTKKGREGTLHRQVDAISAAPALVLAFRSRFFLIYAAVPIRELANLLECIRRTFCVCSARPYIYISPLTRLVCPTGNSLLTPFLPHTHPSRRPITLTHHSYPPHLHLDSHVRPTRQAEHLYAPADRERNP